MREIPLANGRGVALVDDEDYERISAYRWCLIGKGYASRNLRVSDGRRRSAYMHREVLGFPDAPYIDHIDGNKLNNCKANLRSCTASENQRNIGPKKGRRFKGVVARKSGRWGAVINIDFDTITLGTFDTIEEAALAYDAAARLHFGEFARLNFPEGQAA